MPEAVGDFITMTQTTDQSVEYSAVGKRTQRQDAPDKITGHTRYAGDLNFPRLLHARLVLSPYAHARVLAIDSSIALQVPGVVAVYTSETLNMAQANSSSRVQAPLARGEVFWCGHPVAIVLAETAAAAEDGAATVDVDYEPLPVVLDPIAAMHPEANLTRARSKDEVSEIAGGDAHTTADSGVRNVENEQEILSANVSNKAHLTLGDIEEGRLAADEVVEYAYQTHPVHQSYMETQSITVVPDPAGHQLTVWPSTQGMYSVRANIAKALNMPERQIRVESVPIGGAFGGKFGLHEPLVAAAMAVRRPVRLVYTRQEDLLAANPAPQIWLKVKLGAKHDGTLVALQAQGIFDSGAYPGAGPGLGATLLSSLYRCPNIDIRCYEVLTNKAGVGATVDALCHKLEIDPIAFRKQNGVRGGDQIINRSPLPPIGLLECLEEAEKHPLWIERAAHKQPPKHLKGWKVGVGVAAGGWPGGTEGAAAICRLESDGSFTVVVGSVDLTGSDTSMALIAAEGLGVPVDTIVVNHDNTDTMPYSGGTGGSKTTISLGPAVLTAARDARNQILVVAADILEAALEDLEIAHGQVVVKGVPSRNVALTQVFRTSLRVGAKFGPITGRGNTSAPGAAPMYTVHIARVAVDPATGEVQVLDYVAIQDVGCAINPAEVEGQIHGGVAQGIGWAMLEGFEYDENGQLLTSTLMDYALPHTQDVPNITPILIEVSSLQGPFGAKGVGEPPVVPVSAAIANAIKDAVGVHMSELPMTPERVFNALHHQTNGKHK
jgi:CO/xanthine dehydrogenase Mo-binding subunit